MGRSLVAVDLGGSSLRAVQFTVGRGGPTVVKAAVAPLPDGTIEGGEVVDVDALAAALKELWSSARLSSKKVVFGLANNNVLVRMKNLEWDEDDDFRKALKYQVAEELPFDTDTATLDFHTFNEFEVPGSAPGETVRMKQILLVAANKPMVDVFVQAIRKAGLQPVKADLVPFALVRASRPGPVAPDAAEAVIDVGMDVTNVVIHQGGQPRFVRMVAGQSGRFLTHTLAEHFRWSAEDAEATKRELGLLSSPTAEPHPAQQVINHVVSAFVNEIRTSVDFYLQSQPQVRTLSRVVLSGGGSNIKGLAQRLSSELRFPVEYGAPREAVTFRKRLDLPDGMSEHQLAVAVGLAMGAA